MDKVEIATLAWLFIDKKLPEMVGEEKVSITQELPLGFVCYLMHEFAEEFHKEQMKNGDKT